MDKRRPNGLGNPSSNREKIVKNDYYYKCRKKSIIKRSVITVSALAVCGVFWYVKEVPIKAEMYINNSTIEWKPERDNLKGLTFQVFKDGNIVHETKSLKFIDKSQKDTGIPDDVSEIETFRNVNNFKIIWKTPQDKSSNNKYQVFAVNKFGRKVFKTDELVGGEVTGIAKYKIKFNGKEFESNKPEFIIDSSELKKGTYTIEIKSIDNAGNESEYKTFAFDYDTVEFEFKNGELIPIDSEYSNDSHNFYIIDEKIAQTEKEIPQYDKKMFLVNEDLLNILDSGMKPKMTTPSYTIKNNQLNLNWKSPTGNSSSHSFYVEAVNKDTLEKTYSNLLKIEGSSKMLGFHYALNTNKSYSIKATDTYTDDTDISINLSKLDKSEKYYFHIATIDNNGVISDTKTIPINLRVSQSLDSKKSTVKKFVSKTKNVKNSTYNEVIDEISNNFTTDDIKALNKSGIKIYLIAEDFKEYLEEVYDIETKKDDYVKDGKKVYYNVNKSTDSLLKVLNDLLK